jgi:hypothetical protein
MLLRVWTFDTEKVHLSLCKQEQFLNLWILSNEKAKQKFVKLLSFYINFTFVYLIRCTKIQIDFILAGSWQFYVPCNKDPLDFTLYIKINKYSRSHKIAKVRPNCFMVGLF